jgi:hypothetical protein
MAVSSFGFVVRKARSKPKPETSRGRLKVECQSDMPPSPFGIVPLADGLRHDFGTDGLLHTGMGSGARPLAGASELHGLLH